jgi:hypothetical protein
MTEKEIIERKIFLKRQLIQVTKNEIEALENELKQAGGVTEEKHEAV